MDKYTINKRDAEFLKKVDAFRNKNKNVKTRKRFAIRILYGFILICVLIPVYFVLDSGDGNREENVKTAGIRETPSAQSVSKDPPSVPLPKVSEKIISPPDPQLGSMTISVLHSNNDDQVEDSKKVIPHTVSASLPMPPKKIQEENIYVAKSAVCKRLKGRNPAETQDVFVIGQDRYSIVWTEIRSKKLPTLLKHVYYLNGKKYCEISLPIKYPRTRTWSKITLQDEHQAGSWQVKVMEKSGRILKQMAFDVK